MQTMTLDELKNDYDWGHCYYRQEGAIYEAAKRPDPIPGFTGPVTWTLDDVAEVIAYDNGENDERDWVALLRLSDGRFVFMSAGHETGWDCQAGGRSLVGDSLDAVKTLGMSDVERERLGMTLSVAA